MSRRKAASGRVTLPGGRAGEPNHHRRHPSAPRPLPTTSRHAPDGFSRYSPPGGEYTVRPRWHRIAGWIGVGVGVLVAVVNDAMLLGEDLVLLPFGHSELYLLLGVIVAGWSTRFLGVFDRDTVYV